MSRIGRLPIPVPTGVDVTISGQDVVVKGTEDYEKLRNEKGQLTNAQRAGIRSLGRNEICRQCNQKECCLQWTFHNQTGIRPVLSPSFSARTPTLSSRPSNRFVIGASPPYTT